MTVSGSIEATVANQGPGDVTQNFTVTFFEDTNQNGVFDSPQDPILGQATVTVPIPAGQSVPVTVPLAGNVQFSGNVIWGFGDSDNVIAESDETNNVARPLRLLTPQVGQFNPVVEWNKKSFTVRPDSNQVMMTPAVIDLNEDKIPDIVFSTFSGTDYLTRGIVRAISGDDGHELWAATNPLYAVIAAAGLVVGDIDKDGNPEVVATLDSGRMIAFEHDGAMKWVSEAVAIGGVSTGSAALADLDGDGLSEIVIGDTVLTSTGQVKWRGRDQGGIGGAANPTAALSAVADLDLDGSLEVIAGCSAYRADGTLLWNAPIPDGLPAIGNFDTDPYPEIVVVSKGNVYLLEHTGTVAWGPVAVPGGGHGGAPTVSDVDGDGGPEIGVAGAQRYVVLETNGTVKWSSPTQDFSSTATASSVFDFEGDGLAEVIYTDELYLRMYRGTDGRVLYELPKSSGTTYEYPLIVDVDADGNSEIVAVANDYAWGEQHGIYVIGDANDTWVPTRQIWNQHTYHITNVNDDGTIPTHEQNSWQLHNTYRLNAELGRDPLRAPDLTASYLRAGGTYQQAIITARIGNGGELFVPPAISVAFYDEDPKQGGTLLGKAVTMTRLEAGQFEDVSISVPRTAVGHVWVVADDGGTGQGQVREPDENNNVHHALLDYLEPEVTVASPADGSEVAAGTTVLISGHADARRPELGGIPTTLPNRITAVLINGLPVDALDTAGNYFTRVPILPGRNSFDITALDGYGQSAGTTLTVEGTQQAAGEINWVFDASPSFLPDYARTSFDEQNRLLHAELAIRNLGQYDTDNPFYVGVRNITNSTVAARQTAGVTPDGIPYYNFSPAVSDGTLRPTEISGYVNAVFHNPNRVPFQYELVYLTKVNSPPVFTSAPVVETYAGRPYAYPAQAVDPDGDPLRYSLASGPARMTINPATGRLDWLPAVDDLGVHSVTIGVSDGRGGSAEQRYLLSVVEAPANRPPVITTLPVTEAIVGQPYSYDVDATDPDGDDITYSFTHSETYAEAVLSDAPIGYWRLGEASGTTATDVSGNRRDGTFSGNVGLARAGALVQDTDTAVAFDGNTARLAIAYTAPKNNFTLEAWVQTSATHEIDAESTSGTLGSSGQRFLFEPDNRGADGGVGLSIGTNGISVYEHGTGYLPATTVYSGNVGDGFVHVVVTYTNKQPTIYLNGTVARIGLTSPKANVWAPTALGLHVYGRFVGTVDEVAVYDKAMTPDQVIRHYQRGSGGPQPPAPPAGMTIDTTSGQIALIPSTGDLGSHSVSVDASDGRGGADTQTFVVRVQPPAGNHPPVIVSEPVSSVILPSSPNSPGGSVFLTGHDAIWHAGLGASNALGGRKISRAAIDYVRNGSTLPFLFVESTTLSVPGGSAREAAFLSSALGYAQSEYVVANAATLSSYPNLAEALSHYSAIVVASDFGGMLASSELQFLNSHSREIIDFLNAGGGLAAFAESNAGGRIGGLPRFAFLPFVVSSVDFSTVESGNTVTTFGTSLGLTNSDVNGNYSHNYFVPTAGMQSVDLLNGNPNSPLSLAYRGHLDQQGVETTTYTYRLEASDPDGDPLTYSLVAAPASMAIDSRGGTITWNIGPKDVGTYSVSVRVSDGHGGLGIQTFTIGVIANGAGMIRGTNFNDLDADGVMDTGPAGADAGLPGWTIYLDGNRNGRRDSGERFAVTDASGNYALTGLPPGQYVVATESKRGWVQTAPAARTYLVTLVDGQVVTGKDFGNTVASGPNLPPTFNSQPGGTANIDELYRHDAIASDPNSDPLTFDLPLAPEGMTVHPQTGTVVWQPTLDQAGTHQIVLRVQDGMGGVDLQSFTITVPKPNTPPAITSTAVGPAVVGLPYVYQVAAQDAEDDAIAFRLENSPLGASIDLDTGRLTWTPNADQIGNQQVTVVATDTPGAETRQTFTLQVVATAPNDPPTINSTPRTRARAGQSYYYAVQASDPNGDPLSYSLDAAPAGMTIDAAGIIRWQTPADLLGQTVPVTVRVADGRGGEDSQAFVLEVVAQDSNSAPQVTSSPPLSALVGKTYSYNLVARDPEGDPLLWSLDQSPAGMSIDRLRGTIRWTPAAGQTGPQDVVVRVQDVFLAASTQAFTISVRAVNLPPSISSTPPVQANPGELYVYAVRAADPDGDPLSFRFSAAPAGMTIDQHTGLIQWTPTTAGQQTVRVVVDDGQGGIDSQAYVLTVGQTGVNRPPLITSTPVFMAIESEDYAYQVTASDPEGAAVSFSLETTAQGPQIDATSGLLTWPSAPAGSYTLTVIATDPDNGRARQSYVLVVSANEPPRITSTPGTSVVAGRQYAYDVRFFDAEWQADRNAYPVSFTLDSGPAGMAMDPLGRIRWQTGIPDIAAGPHAVQVTVRDAHGATATQTFQVAVEPDTVVPQVTVTASTNLADLGGSVTFYVQATDNIGVADLALTFDGQYVPLDPVSLGLLVGRVETSATVTPSRSGRLDAVATATDAAGNAAQSSLQIRVIDRSDTTYPQIRIDRLEQGGRTLAREGDTITDTVTYLADLFATVQDTNLTAWRVEYARTDQVDLNNFAAAADPDYVEIAHGMTPITDTTLPIATFDPTLLSNDNYVIRVWAEDENGLIGTRGLLVGVSGEAKLGNFHLDFTDVQLPLAGIPITITRSYDTLNARSEGDFGYGWSLGVQEGQIRETVPEGKSFQIGTRVYVTNPEGKRVGFTFDPIQQGSLFGVIWTPQFKADPGVSDKLEVYETQVGAPGTIYAALSGPYNPSQYKLTTKDGTVYEYDQFAGLQKITDKAANTVTFSAAGIVHSSGAAITFERDFRGRITRIAAPDGSQVRYTYSAAGDLVGFTNQASETTTYGYLPDPKHPHFLNSITDAKGVQIFAAQFDAAGRLTGSTDALGHSVSQNFDPGSFTGTITDARGNVTELFYDDRGNVLEKREPNSADPAHPLVTKYEYNDPLNPDKETKIADRNGIVELRTYDAAGNMTVVTRAAGTAQATTTSYAYNAAGNVTSIRQNGLPPTVFQYDPAGKLTQIVNAVGTAAAATYDGLGRQTSFTDFNGNATTYDYTGGCACGSPRQITYVDGTYELFTYNGYGQVTSRGVYEQDGTLVETSSTQYDDLGRAIEETQGSGAGQTVTRKVYDGNLLDWEIIVNPASPNETPATPLAQRKSRITDYAYDAAGRLITQTDAEGGVVQFRYDANGNRTLLQDPVGNITTWVYDAVNRMVEERDPFYWVEYVAAHPATFAGLTGDAFLAQVVTANELSSGASAAANLGAAHVRVYAYDGEGNQTKIIDRNGRRREFTYDPLGRLTEERWYDPSGLLVRTITSTYDAAGNLKSLTDPDSQYTYTYDTLNRVTSVDNAGTPDMPHVILTYQYDAMGNVTRTTDNLGVSVVSTYDSRNRLASRWWEGDSVEAARVDFLYTAAGREKRIDRYSDLAGTNRVAYTDRTYDTAGRSQTISHQRAVDDVIARYDYAYDFAGLLDHEDRSGESYPNNDWHADYTYDRTGQLLGADYSGADVIPEQVDEYYRYDANGNRVESYLHGTGYRTGTANQLLTDGTYNYEYDGEGNMVRKTEIATGKVTTFEYDHRNLMVRATIWSSDPASGGIILHEEQYRYDSFAHRLRSVLDGEQTIAVFLRDDMWARWNGSSASPAYFLVGIDVGGWMVISPTTSGVFWSLTDKQGSTSLVADDKGRIVNIVTSGAFGDVIETHEPALPLVHAALVFNPTFSFFDSRTRSYDPSLGRFLQMDLLSFQAGDTNLYRFVSNSPLNGMDPSGMMELGEYAGASLKALDSADLAVAGFAHGFSFATFKYLGYFMQTRNSAVALDKLMRDTLVSMTVGWALSPISQGAGTMDIKVNPLPVFGTYLSGYSGFGDANKVAAANSLKILIGHLEEEGRALLSMLLSLGNEVKDAFGHKLPDLSKDPEFQRGGFINGLRAFLRVLG